MSIRYKKFRNWDTGTYIQHFKASFDSRTILLPILRRVNINMAIKHDDAAFLLYFILYLHLLPANNVRASFLSARRGRNYTINRTEHL